MIAPNPSNENDDDIPQGFDPDDCDSAGCDCEGECFDEEERKKAWDEATLLSNTLSNLTITALMHMVKRRICIFDTDGDLVPYSIEGFRPYTGDIMLTLIPDPTEREG
jgi:hypothetical protein